MIPATSQQRSMMWSSNSVNDYGSSYPTPQSTENHQSSQNWKETPKKSSQDQRYSNDSWKETPLKPQQDKRPLNDSWKETSMKSYQDQRYSNDSRKETPIKSYPDQRHPNDFFDKSKAKSTVSSPSLKEEFLPPNESRRLVNNFPPSAFRLETPVKLVEQDLVPTPYCKKFLREGLPLYNPKQCLLILGEADFSFSLGLVTSFKKENKPGQNIVATSYMHLAENAPDHCWKEKRILHEDNGRLHGIMDKIHSSGGTIRFGVDAGDLQNTLMDEMTSFTRFTDGFDRIVFPFPRALVQSGSHSENTDLFTRFFKSAKSALRDKGEIHLILHVSKRSTTQFDDWGIRDIAEDAGFVYEAALPFQSKLMPGYTNKDAKNRSWIPQDSQIYIFSPKIETVFFRGDLIDYNTEQRGWEAGEIISTDDEGYTIKDNEDEIIKDWPAKDLRLREDNLSTVVTFSPKCKFGMKFKGNVITDVVENSQASKRGVRIGWRIRTINGVEQPDETKVIIQNCLKDVKRKKPIVINFQKTSNKKTITFSSDDVNNWGFTSKKNIVKRVIAGGVAAEHGLMEGWIIAKVNGISIPCDANAIRSAILGTTSKGKPTTILFQEPEDTEIEFKVGEMVWAQGENGHYYDAKIQSKTDAGYRVLYQHNSQEQQLCNTKIKKIPSKVAVAKNRIYHPKFEHHQQQQRFQQQQHHQQQRFPQQQRFQQQRHPQRQRYNRNRFNPYPQQRFGRKAHSSR